MGGLIGLILVLCLIGVVMWLLFQVVPMPPLWRNVILAIVVIVVLLWLLGGQLGIKLPG